MDGHQPIAASDLVRADRTNDVSETPDTGYWNASLPVRTEFVSWRRTDAEVAAFNVMTFAVFTCSSDALAFVDVFAGACPGIARLASLTVAGVGPEGVDAFASKTQPRNYGAFVYV